MDRDEALSKVTSKIIRLDRDEATRKATRLDLDEVTSEVTRTVTRPRIRLPEWTGTRKRGGEREGSK